MGIPMVTKNQLLPLESKVGPFTLDDYKKCLILNRFPFYLDYPVVHRPMQHDYTAIKLEDDTEQIPQMGAVGSNPAVVTVVLNLPWHNQVNSIGCAMPPVLRPELNAAEMP